MSLDIVEKVKKLLSLSKSSNEHEAATAAALANKLIQQYRISEAQLSQEGEVIFHDKILYHTGRIIPWKNTLACRLAEVYGCKVINNISFPHGRKISNFKLVGRKTDCEICFYMFSWLVLEIQRLADLNAKGKGHKYVFSYCEGIVFGVIEQLNKKQEAKEEHSSALLKIDNRINDTNLFIKKMNIGSSSAKSKAQIDSEALANGIEKGKNIHLGSHLESKNIKQLSN